MAAGLLELLVSRDGATDWKSLGKAEANVQGFRYYAANDGDYWFALQLFDRRDKLLQAGPIQPQLHVVVDTVQPALSIAGSLDVDGAIVRTNAALHTSCGIRYDVSLNECCAAGRFLFKKPSKVHK